MDRFSTPQTSGRPDNTPSRPAENREDFSEMVDATTRKPGVFGKLLVLSLIIVSVAVTAFVGYAIIKGVGSQNQIEKDKYQAVFLSDGQIYFGKLSDTEKSYAILEDIYYLQVLNADAVQQAGDVAQEPEIQLVKLGNEIHGPVDKMFINSNQILFWENLKEDGRVSAAIKTYQLQGPSADAEGAQAPQPETAPIITDGETEAGPETETETETE